MWEIRTSGLMSGEVKRSGAPPDGDGWLHEIKHDGHRLVAIVAGEADTAQPGAITLIAPRCSEV